MTTGGCSGTGRNTERSKSGSDDEPMKGRLTDILQVLAGLETDRAPGRDANFLTSSRVTADATLARFHLEHTETAQLDPVASLHRHAHRIEHRINSYLGLDLGDVGDLRNLVNDVDLDHPLAAPG